MSNIVGVYKITNKINNKCYIGVSRNILARWRAHKRTVTHIEYKEYNYPLYTDMRLYGLDNFEFSVLEECNRSELSIKEKYYISIYNPEYNQTSGGLGGHDPKPTYFNDIICDLKDLSLTIVDIAKKYNYCTDMISKINSGDAWYTDTLSYPIRKYNPIKNAENRYKCPVLQYNMNGELIAEYPSASAACRANNVSDVKNGCRHIHEVCTGKRKSAYKSYWKFKN